MLPLFHSACQIRVSESGKLVDHVRASEAKEVKNGLAAVTCNAALPAYEFKNNHSVGAGE